jgi:hypothetical protein
MRWEDDPEWLAHEDLEGSYRGLFEIYYLGICLDRPGKKLRRVLK